ncbi:hypothetical protein DL96DRAFT_1558847 [Flagelloscypha sp. PMI_526]|nr:hypothetical protein DL96DRAFT_1558847 [Flagelloscypha sp. PMI_526]
MRITCRGVGLFERDDGRKQTEAEGSQPTSLVPFCIPARLFRIPKMNSQNKAAYLLSLACAGFLPLYISLGQPATEVQECLRYLIHGKRSLQEYTITLNSDGMILCSRVTAVTAYNATTFEGLEE